MTDADAVAVVARKQRMLMPCPCTALRSQPWAKDGRDHADRLVMRGLAEWHHVNSPSHSAADMQHIRLTAAGWALAGGAPLWVAA